MNYMDILYKEYIDTLNIRTNDKKEHEDFYYWLEENQKILRLYELFLQSLDLTPYKGIVEINKNINDSILKYTPYETKGVLVSPYVKTGKINKYSITVNGKVVFNYKEVYKNGIKNTEEVPAISYKNRIISIDELLNYTTHFPIELDTLDTMKKLIELDKNVFIGLYGRLEDKNKLTNLKKLYEIKKELEEGLDKDFLGECIETKEYYFAAITPKLRFRKKYKIL